MLNFIMCFLKIQVYCFHCITFISTHTVTIEELHCELGLPFAEIMLAVSPQIVFIQVFSNLNYRLSSLQSAEVG